MKSGIYIIKCSVNGNRYIGSTKNLNDRKYNHWIRLKRNEHHNRHMQSVWNKYGSETFSFEVIEIVEDFSKLIEREQYWIDTLKPELNKAIKAESGFAGLNHTEETKRKLSEIQTERLKSQSLRNRLSSATKEYLSSHANPNIGRHLSEEQKEKIREANKRQFDSAEGRKKHHDAMVKWMTPEMKDRISKAKQGSKVGEETKKKMADKQSSAWKNYTDEQRRARIEKTGNAIAKAKGKWRIGFVSPDGKEYRNVYNLLGFCKEHNLSNSNMHLLDSEKKKSYKGWTKIKT